MRRRTAPVWLAVILAVADHSHGAFGADAPKAEGAPLKYEEPKHLTGAIYVTGSDRQKLLFKFERKATRSGSTLAVVRDYNYPDGKAAARERVVYEGDALASFELEEMQTGGKGSAKIRRVAGNPGKAVIDFEYSESGAASRPKTRSEPLADNTLIGDMIGPFLGSHYDALSRGERVKFRYLVVPRRETVGFTFAKDSESTVQGRAVLLVKMAPTSPVISALVDPLFFRMEKAPPHHVLEYLGRTTPKLEVRGKWKDLDAVTVFDWNE